MARVYTELLAAGVNATGALAVVYTVPVGKVAVVRDVVMIHFNGSPAAVYLTTNGPGGSHPVIDGQHDLGSGDARHWDGRQVLAAGDQLELSANVANARYRITGYVFDV